MRLGWSLLFIVLVLWGLTGLVQVYQLLATGSSGGYTRGRLAGAFILATLCTLGAQKVWAKVRRK